MGLLAGHALLIRHGPLLIVTGALLILPVGLLIAGFRLLLWRGALLKAAFWRALDLSDLT